MKTPAARLIIFDIDGTLLLSGPRVRELLAQAFEESFGQPARLDGLSFAGHTDRWILRTLLQRARIGDPPLPKGDFALSFMRFARRYEHLMRIGYPSAEGPHLLPGVRQLLAALDAEPGVRLLLASGNLQATAHIKLDRFGLRKYLPLGVYGDAYETRTQIFRAAIELAERDLGFEKGKTPTWIVGDTVSDVRATKEVGARSLAVLTGPSGIEDPRKAGPDATIEDFSSLHLVLDLLLKDPPTSPAT